jgi:transmembrane sensor
MNLEQALQQAEKLASGQYSPDELHDFLSFMDTAEPSQVNRVLEVYQEAIHNQPVYQLQVGPDFMSRLKALRPAESADRMVMAGDKEDRDLIPAGHRIVSRTWIRWAAAILILLATGGYLLFLSKKGIDQSPLANNPINPATPKNDVLPGGNKAILTLSGGRQIILDSAQQGDLTIQGNARVSKMENGKLVYQPVGNSLGETTTYNTLTTPRGGQYQLKLPDGTQVWLNAASSITYPTAFIGKERKVKITGEAYFEVAKNANLPFLVEENDLVIKVLGTRFDVNGYVNEPIRSAVLIDGSVNVLYQKKEVHLEPGMQAQVRRELAGDQRSAADQKSPADQSPSANQKSTGDHRNPVLTVVPGNIEQTLAWKNGFFAFANADLPTVMRQIARWYDVDVNYEGAIPKDAFEFNGKIGRSLTLDQVLKLLTQTHVHYTIRGKQLTIQP